MLLKSSSHAYTHPAHEKSGTSLAYSSLATLGRKTITGMLSTCGLQFTDWSAHYRLFERKRVDPTVFFSTTLHTAASYLDTAAPLVALLDDTLLPKRGRHVAGTAWWKDPLGPHFQTNLIWGQRFLQCSIALPDSGTLDCGPARAIPITFAHAPKAKKPGRTATPEQHDAYKVAVSELRISAQGCSQMHALRARMDADPAHAHRQLLMCVDGSYTNSSVLKNLPPRTTVIGRVRKDAKLYALPSQQPDGRGRKRSYGQALPTPEQMRQDASIPWKTVRVHAAGKDFDFEIKSIGPVRWRAAGGTQVLRLIIVRPLAYRPRKGARLLYREPAYVLCTDPTLSDEDILQAFVWRWDIEVNFRDEKTLVGVGQAQVRTVNAAVLVPQFQVAMYSFLLMADRMQRGITQRIPLPKWRGDSTASDGRIPTNELLRILRSELWGKSIGVVNFSDFSFMKQHKMKSEKIERSLKHAIIYAS
jgi:hypothetical protein